MNFARLGRGPDEGLRDRPGRFFDNYEVLDAGCIRDAFRPGRSESGAARHAPGPRGVRCGCTWHGSGL